MPKSRPRISARHWHAPKYKDGNTTKTPFHAINGSHFFTTHFLSEAADDKSFRRRAMIAGWRWRFLAQHEPLHGAVKREESHDARVIISARTLVAGVLSIYFGLLSRSSSTLRDGFHFIDLGLPAYSRAAWIREFLRSLLSRRHRFTSPACRLCRATRAARRAESGADGPKRNAAPGPSNVAFRLGDAADGRRRPPRHRSTAPPKIRAGRPIIAR